MPGNDKATNSPAGRNFFADNSFNYGIFGLLQSFGGLTLPETEVGIARGAASQYRIYGFLSI